MIMFVSSKLEMQFFTHNRNLITNNSVLFMTHHFLHFTTLSKITVTCPSFFPETNLIPLRCQHKHKTKQIVVLFNVKML